MATKAEALAWLATQPLIDAVGTPVVDHLEPNFGDPIYRVAVRKINSPTNDCIRYETIHFVVIDEGGAGERALFLKNNIIAWDNSHEAG